MPAKAPQDPLADIEHSRSEPRPDFSQPIPRKPLPADLQEKIDNESTWTSIYEGHASESTDSSVRYAAYASRFRTILVSAQRYVAYTSDIGESFRPIVHPNAVRAAYGVSWAYLIGDVSYEGYKAYLRNQRALHPELAEGKVEGMASAVKGTVEDKSSADKVLEKPVGQELVSGSLGAQSMQGRVVPIEDYRAVMVQRAVFQSIASMGLPAFTIHSIVRYSGRALKNAKNVRIRTWGPIGLGLAAVPALPFLFDQPVESVTEWVFHKGFEAVGGPSAVGHTPDTGRQRLDDATSRAGKGKEKEL
nr:hypothetical protein B0A51_00602 [Rachicladosporium sp. CCFEE 5018]